MQTHSQGTERLGLFACLTNLDAIFSSQDHEDSKTGQSHLQLLGKLKLSRERVGHPGLVYGTSLQAPADSGHFCGV